MIISNQKLLANTVTENNQEETNRYVQKVLDIPKRIEEVQKNTTSLATRIKDDSNIELNNQTLQYINNLKGVIQK